MVGGCHIGGSILLIRGYKWVDDFFEFMKEKLTSSTSNQSLHNIKNLIMNNYNKLAVLVSEPLSSYALKGEITPRYFKS